MDRHDLAGVVAATQENIFYLSGHASWSQNAIAMGGSQVYVVYPATCQIARLTNSQRRCRLCDADEVWLKEPIFTGARAACCSRPSKLGKEEKRTLEITESTPKGATPEKALAQLIKDKGMDRSRIGNGTISVFR